MIKTKWNTLLWADQQFGSCYTRNKTDPEPLTRAVLCGNGKIGKLKSGIIKWENGNWKSRNSIINMQNANFH